MDDKFVRDYEYILDSLIENEKIILVRLKYWPVFCSTENVRISIQNQEEYFEKVAALKRSLGYVDKDL